MPIHIRNFHYNKLVDAKKKENESVSKAKTSGASKAPSKVRVRR